MPHALTEDYSTEDSQVRHAAALASPWPATADPRARTVHAVAEQERAAAPDEAGCGQAGKCD
jgi:hypothetical protein